MPELDTKDIEATKLIHDLQDISFTQIALIILGTWLCIYIARKVLPFIANRGPNQLRLYLLGAVPIIRLLLFTVAILSIIPIIFNITFQNFLIIAGGASVAIGFAFKDLFTGLIAGVVAVIERPYKPGDWVEIDGDYGEVKTVGLRTIIIQTADDDTITIPHEKIWSKNISNSNNGSHTLMCVTTFHLEPDHDAKLIKLKMFDVVNTSAYLNYTKPVNVVLDQTLYGTCYKIRAYPFDLRDQFEFITDITIRVKEALHECGVKETIAVPTGSLNN